MEINHKDEKLLHDDEVQPILPEDQIEVENTPEKKKASVFGAFFNITNCAVGAGILSLPYAFEMMGLLQALIAFFIFAMASVLSLILLPMCAEAAGTESYEATVRVAFGTLAMKAFQAFIVLYTIGIAVGYVVIVGDLLPPTIAIWAGVEDYEELWYFSPWFFELIVSAVVLLPLASLKRLDSLKYSSIFAILAVMYFVGLVIVESIIDINEYRINGYVETTGESVWDSIEWWRFSSDVFLGIPIIAFSFGGHLQAIALYSELKPEVKSVFNWVKVAMSSNVFLSTIYLLVGGLSYLRFLPGEDGNVLEQMLAAEPDNIPVQIASVMMTTVVILSYPLFTWPSRFAIDRLLFPKLPSLYDPTPEAKSWKVTIRYFIITVILVTVTYVLAAFVGELAIVFGLVGATGAVLVKYIIPNLLYLKLGPVYRKKFTNKNPPVPIWQKIILIFLIVLWTCVGAISTVTVIIDAVETFQA